MNAHDTITRLAPTPDPLDADWSATALSAILADRAAAPRSDRRPRRRRIALITSSVVLLSAGAAVAAAGPDGVAEDAIRAFFARSDTSQGDLGFGSLDDPRLAAKFDTERGLFAFWVATSPTGSACSVTADSTWDGTGEPTADQLDVNCDTTIVLDETSGSHQGRSVEDFGGFFKDAHGPIVYGVSPYAGTSDVRVRGEGVDVTLPVRPDSLGYGAAIPQAASAATVELTFLDASGTVLGTKQLVAPAR